MARREDESGVGSRESRVGSDAVLPITHHPSPITLLPTEALSRRGALRGIGWTMAAATGIALTKGQAAAAEDATPASAATVPPDFKVVLHAAQEQHWDYVLSNLRNLIQEWPQAELRVVVDGSAVLTLQGENVLTKELANAAAAGVVVQVCPNALREHEIDPATIPAYAEVSLGGVVQLVLAHREGFVYVKP